METLETCQQMPAFPRGYSSGEAAADSSVWNAGSSVHLSPCAARSLLPVTCWASAGVSVFDSWSIRFWAWSLEMLFNDESFMTLSYCLFEKKRYHWTLDSQSWKGLWRPPPTPPYPPIQIPVEFMEKSKSKERDTHPWSHTELVTPVTCYSELPIRRSPILAIILN